MATTETKPRVSPFAHLAAAFKPRAADDDDKKKKDDAKAADDDKKDDDCDDDKKKKDDAKAADDDKKDDDKEASAAALLPADGDDDSDRVDDNDMKLRPARARERGRVRAILLSDPGKANPVAGAHFATGTAMPRRQAIEMLAAIGAGTAPAAQSRSSADPLRDRMADVPKPAVGAGDARGNATLADAIVAAGKKRRGEV